MSVQTDQVIDATRSARSAVEKSAEAWKQGEQRLAEGVGSLARVPQYDAGRAVEIYFDYLRRGLEVNRNYVNSWVGSLTSLSEIGRDRLTAAATAAQGHADAISDWITGEVETVADTARAQVEYSERVREDRTREQYAAL